MPVVERFVNISHDSSDSVLLDARGQVTGEEVVTGALGAKGVQDVVEQLAPPQPPSNDLVLDLIAHSKDGVLQLGSWDVGLVATAQALVAALTRSRPGLRLAGIRLLGCNTWYTAAGRTSMALLRDTFGCMVAGTTVPIGRDDFATAGFHRTSFLKKMWPNLPAPPAPLVPQTNQALNQVRQRWFARFPLIGVNHPALVPLLARETLAEAGRERMLNPPRIRWGIREITPTQLRDYLSGAFAPVREARGLLALPDYELIARAVGFGGVPLYHRVTSLLGGAFLRIYPKSHPRGVIIRGRAEDGSALRQIYENAQILLPPGTPLVPPGR